MTAQVEALAGGTTLLVEESHALPVVSITVAAHGGASLDPDGREGLCRIMARLSRRTGDGLPAERIDERIDALGASLGADVGQSTMMFHGTVIARSLDAFMDLMLGVIARPSLAEEELARLKRETLAELVEARDNDRHLAERWFRQRLFTDHPYGRPASGTPASVEAVTQRDVAALQRRLLARGNVVVALAGDVDLEKARAIGQRIGSTLPEGDRAPDPLTEPSLAKGRRLAFVDKPERTQAQIFIGCLGTHPRDPDHVALHVGSTIFGGTFTARLMHEVRSKRGWSYGAYSNLPYDRHRRGFSLWTFPKASDAAPCIALQLEMLESLWKDGVTAKELAWAKRYLVRSHAFAIDTASKRLGQALDEQMYDLPMGYHTGYVEHVRAVTLDDVNEAIRKRITPDDLLVSVVGTESEIGDAVRAAIPALASAEVIPFDRDG